jgi:hypothetical protein
VFLTTYAATRGSCRLFAANCRSHQGAFNSARTLLELLAFLFLLGKEFILLLLILPSSI